MSLLAEAESSVTSSVADILSNVASSTSTPPTTAADSDSLHSDACKPDTLSISEPLLAVCPSEIDRAFGPTPQPALQLQLVTPEPQAEVQVTPASPAVEAWPKRPRRARASAPVYNLAKLSGTDGHGKRRANGDVVLSGPKRRTISGDTLVDDSTTSTATPMSTRAKTRSSKDAVAALDLASPPSTRRRGSRATTGPVVPTTLSSLGSRISKMSKRGGKAVAGGVSKLSRELLRLRDTNEFAHIDDRPVIHTVWANGKYVDPNAPPPSPKQTRAKNKPGEGEPDESETQVSLPVKPRGPKKFVAHGLYAGQDDLTAMDGLNKAERNKLNSIPELRITEKVNTVMPIPMYAGLRTLMAGRDFKLPFMTCNPLPPGQPKPDEWKKMTKNRFIGNSKDYWRKSPHYQDYSKCVCKPEDGCGDNCQNRIMLYECNEINCNAGKDTCTNRAFATLAARRAKGGKYRVGVEVIKTSDRGYGVRSNRCFRPNQIIMEYAGEIITEDECQRRMNEEYKNNECYYLMSFDQNMIIDATTGSIARFVNHSCNPNCRMIKWIVSGQPRMALFAGDKPIMTGDELTYDYNFDPFSAKNVQKCLCGSHNCRGVLGPRPREVKVPKTDLKKAVKGTIKAGKRKLKEMLGEEATTTGQAEEEKTKKRKTQPTTTGATKRGTKGLLPAASLEAAKGAIKKGVSSMSLAKKKSGKSTPAAKRRAASAGGSSSLLKKATTTRKLVKRQSAVAGKVKSRAVTSRSSSLTMMESGAEDLWADEEEEMGGKGGSGKVTPKKTPKKTTPKKTTPKKMTKGKASPREKNVTPKTAHRRLSGKPKMQKSKPTIKLVDE